MRDSHLQGFSGYTKQVCLSFTDLHKIIFLCWSGMMDFNLDHCCAAQPTCLSWSGISKNIFLPQMDIPLWPHLKRKNKLNFPFLGGFGVVGSCFWKFMVAFMRNEGFNDDYFTPAFLFMFSFSLFLLTFARAFQSLLLVLGSAHLTKHL